MFEFAAEKLNKDPFSLELIPRKDFEKKVAKEQPKAPTQELQIANTEDSTPVHQAAESDEVASQELVVGSEEIKFGVTPIKK